jgi:hypothetical protein
LGRKWGVNEALRGRSGRAALLRSAFFTAMRSKASVARIFLLSCAAVLSLTALAKLSSVFGHAKILDFPDPLWGISNRRFLGVLAVLELAVAALVFTRVRVEMKFLITAWLGANFLLYRVAVAVLKPGKLCPCLGSVTERLQINETTAGYILSGIAFYMFIGGLFCYFQRPRHNFESCVTTVQDQIS